MAGTKAKRYLTVGSLDSVPQSVEQILEGKGTATVPKTSKKGRVANKDKVPSGRKGVPSFTPKEGKFLKGVVTEVIPGKKTKREVAMEVYDTDDPNVASAIAAENLSKPKFQAILADAFEQAGINPKSLADVLKDALGATKTASLAGEVYPSTEPDHSVRVTAVKAISSILADKDDDGKGGNTFNFNLGGNQTFVKKMEVKK